MQHGDTDATVCGNHAEGCVNAVRSDDVNDFFRETGARAVVQTYPGPIPRIPAPILRPGPTTEGNYAGWERVEDITFQGYQGACYVSLGEYALFSGDPIEDSTHPAGDRMCMIFFEHTSTLVTSYDFGGDGSVEYEALEIRATWADSDLALQDGVTAATDQAGFEALTARLVEGDLEDALSFEGA